MMHHDLSRQDLLLVDRYLDGELPAAEVEALRRRFEAEPLLRAGLAARTQLRRGFRAGAAQSFAAPAGFAGSVVAAARRLPVDAGGEVERAVRLCRRVLLAAAAVVALAMVWQSGLFRDRNDGTVQAAPDQVQQVIDALDARLKARTGAAERK